MRLPLSLAVCTLFFAASLLADAEPAGVFVAVGYGGRRISSRDGIHWENDQRWSNVTADNDDVLFNVAYGLHRFIAVGGGARFGHILSSRDGKDWKELPLLKGRVATIAFGRDRFVAGHDGELLWSTDGETFHPGKKLEIKGSIHARRSACGDTEAGFMTVIIGDADLWEEKSRVAWRASTTDGETWASQSVDTPAARDIAYGAGHFVVVGPAGLIEQSHDGQNWTRCETAADEDFRAVVWTGSQFLAQGKTLWTSPDGLVWKAQPKPLPCQPAWAQDGVGGIGLSWGGNLFFSSDFIDWKKVEILPGPSFTAAAWGRPE